MLFWIIFIIGIVMLLLFHLLDQIGDNSSPNTSTDKKEKSLSELLESLQESIDSSKGNKANEPIDYMPEDPDKYIFAVDNRLVGYNGNEDVLCVPIGTQIIGDDYDEIKKGKAWDIVYIPKSVIMIKDCALPWVESVYYEGTEEEFQRIPKGELKYSNFCTGFIPNYAKNMPNPENSKVKEVKFCYNVNISELYKGMAEWRKKRASTKTNKPIDYMPEDPDKYILDQDGKHLFGYTGNEDILYVPIGTRIIGMPDRPIKENTTWDAVYIPKSVDIINEWTLPFVKNIYYEGTSEEYKKICIIGDNLIKYNVRFFYNTNIPEIYKGLAEKRKNGNL